MSEATRISLTSGKNRGESSFNLTPPAGIISGDLIVAVQLSASPSAYSETWLAKGWWRLYASSVNSRAFAIYARIYNPSTPADDYIVTTAISASTKWAIMVFRDHKVVSQSDIVMGSGWLRSNNGGSQGLIVSPGIVTPDKDYTAISITGEASNALGGWTRTAGDFTLWGEITESATANIEIEWITVSYKSVPTAAATADQSITYTSSASNGVGIQLAIPGKPAASIETGRIGAHAALNPSSNSISVGLDKLGGTTVQVALMSSDGNTELARQTVSADTTTGWANVTFTGLEPASNYHVRFYVDGVLQTDASLFLKTLPVGAASYTVVAGSCQFTGSNHPVFDRIREDNPLFVAHMGDLHYADATTEIEWRNGMESSLSATRFKQLLRGTFLNWTPDNHDRIITNPTGAGTGLNLGETAPQTAIEWKYFAGSSGWSTPDTLGRTWVAGRVRYIQTDGWSVRDDGDGDPAPRTFLGSAQKQWFKDTLTAAQEPLIIWFCQWTATNHANGRWNSFPEESSELEAFINARPDLKRRMVMIGGDSHSLQADDGSRTSGNYRFSGIPSLNISGFNRSGTANDGQTFWTIANAPLRSSAQPEADWGGYSRVSITDDGMHLRFLWEGIRVNAAGVTDRVAFYSRSYGSPYDRVFFGDIPVSSLNVGDKTLWQEPISGSTI